MLGISRCLLCQVAVLLIITVSAPTIGVADECRNWMPEDGLRDDLIVGEVDVKAADIFDATSEEESRWYHQWINKLHKKTDDEVVARQVLLKMGESFDMRKVEETERFIRSRKYIKDAIVEPLTVCGNRVNINVRTTDNWTLTPGISAGRSGGYNRLGVNIEEHNLFGKGKSLSFSFDSDQERDTSELAYEDLQFLGSQKQLGIAVQNNSDGEGYAFGYTLPFYQFDSKRAWGIALENSRKDISLYQDGEVDNTIGQDSTAAKLFYGWSKGRTDDHVHRYKVGWQFDQKEYFATETSADINLTDTQSYPWMGYEYSKEQFVKKENFRTMGIVEDVQLGHRLSATAGLLTQSFGSDDDYLLLDTRYQKGFAPAQDKLGLVSLGLNSYIGNGIHSGERLNLQAEWFDYNDGRSSWRFAGTLNAASNLQPGEQILLGGDTGLRGYPTGMQAGDKSVLLTAEKRYFFDWYPFQLAKVGAVAFADAGTAWGDGNQREVLGDVGVGLRIVPTRSSSHSVLHIDLAFPTTIKDDMDSYQLLIETKSSF